MPRSARRTGLYVDEARAFVDELRTSSSRPVVYAEPPGAKHDFDLFHSIRFEAVIDGVEAFMADLTSFNGEPARSTNGEALLRCHDVHDEAV